MKLKWIVSFLVSLACSSVQGDPMGWLEQENLNNLGLYSWMSDDCPFSLAEFESRLEGEFLRARLKPNNNLNLNLTVNVSCMKVSNKGGNSIGYVVSYDVRFGTQMQNGVNVLYESPDHGSMVVASDDSESKQYFLRSIGDAVSESLTDYLKVNVE